MKKYLFYLTLLLLCFSVGLIYSNADWDLWARLTVGKTFLQTGHIFQNDFLSYTTTHRWYDHEWGSSVIFYFFSNRWGDAGLFVLKTLVSFLTLFIISKSIEVQGKKETQYNIFFYWLMLIGMSQVALSTIRCHIFTFMFFALWIYVLERVRRGENRLLWIFPVTTIIWSNMHGGYVSGLGLLVMYAIGEFLNKKPCKKYLLTIIPTCLVTLINPYGIGYVWYVLVATTMKRPHITEYLNSFTGAAATSWMKYKIFFALGMLTFVYNFINLIKIWLEKKNAVFKDVDYTKIIVVAVCMYLSVRYIKYQPFFIIGGGIFLYNDFYEMYNAVMSKIRGVLSFLSDRVVNNLSYAKSAFIYMFIIMGAISVIYSSYGMKMLVPLNKYPAMSYEFVKINKIQGNMLTDFHWGSYAAWKLYPQNYVAIDGRYEEVFDDSIAAMSYSFFANKGKNWYDFVRKYHTDVIVTGLDNPVYRALEYDGLWKTIYNDKISAVLVPAKLAKPRDQYIQPSASQEYYQKTKYETGVEFIK